MGGVEQENGLKKTCNSSLDLNPRPCPQMNLLPRIVTVDCPKLWIYDFLFLNNNLVNCSMKQKLWNYLTLKKDKIQMF